MEPIMTLMKVITIFGLATGLAFIIGLVRKGFKKKRKVPFYDYRFKDWRTLPDPEFSEWNNQRS